MREAHYPGRPPIDSYGNGGFRFAGMSHRGSLLFLPGGVYSWAVQNSDDLKLGDFERVFADKGVIEFLLFGTGDTQHFPPSDIAEAFNANGLGLDAMTTGAACRTYNVLLDEGRAVAAAVIAVD